MVTNQEFNGNVLMGTPLQDEEKRGYVKGRGEQWYISVYTDKKVAIFRFTTSPKILSGYKVFTSINDLLKEFSFTTESQAFIDVKFKL